MQLSDIAQALSAKIIGDDGLTVDRIVHPADAEGPRDLALALSKEALAALGGTRAGAVVVPPGTQSPNNIPAVVYGGNERMAVAVLTALFDPGPAHDAGVHPAAVVAADAAIGESVSIGACAVVGAGTTIGAGTVILPQVTIGAGVIIGRDCVLHPGVRIGDRVRLGDRVTVHSNTVVGSDGFSFIPVLNPDGSGNGIDTPKRTHSLGTVIIGDDVEIGSGTTIDRATLRETRIGRGTKIDNQVQIAHNVVIGEDCLDLRHGRHCRQRGYRQPGRPRFGRRNRRSRDRWGRRHDCGQGRGRGECSSGGSVFRRAGHTPQRFDRAVYEYWAPEGALP